MLFPHKSVMLRIINLKLVGYIYTYHVYEFTFPGLTLQSLNPMHGKLCHVVLPATNFMHYMFLLGLIHMSKSLITTFLVS
jgi:hypothetical protein